MVKNRVHRLNSLLKEVISEVVRKDVRDPRLPELITITRVDISSDLHYAKVFISVIGTQLEKDQAIEALQSAAGFIGVQSSKKVTLRYFPSLTFKLDTSVDQHLRIDTLLGQIRNEQSSRKAPPENDESD